MNSGRWGCQLFFQHWTVLNIVFNDKSIIVHDGANDCGMWGQTSMFCRSHEIHFLKSTSKTCLSNTKPLTTRSEILKIDHLIWQSNQSYSVALFLRYLCLRYLGVLEVEWETQKTSLWRCVTVEVWVDTFNNKTATADHCCEWLGCGGTKPLQQVDHQG